jgi:excisionase family DNA binding protein
MATVASHADGLKPYLTVEQAAELLHQSPRSIHERTRLRAIPMRKLRGTRRVLIPRDELFEFMGGADLEVVEKADGSVIVRPREFEAVA